MTLYKGSAFRKFLLDRYAMGFTTETIVQEFKSTQGIDITEKEIEDILGPDSEEEIKAREQELLQELSSGNFFTALQDIKRELQTVREFALKEKDLKSYAQLTNTMLKSIDSLISTSGAFKKKFEDQSMLQTQNNYYVLNVLQQDGLIKIIDENKLRSLWGVGVKSDGLQKTEEAEKTEVRTDVPGKLVGESDEESVEGDMEDGHGDDS